MEEIILPDFRQTYAQKHNDRSTLDIAIIVAHLLAIGLAVYTVRDLINKRIKQKNRQR
jgi:hypothetical protein